MNITADQITANMMVQKEMGYVMLSLSYGFAVEEGGVRKYRPVRVIVPGVSFGPQHWESGKRDEKGKKLPAGFTPDYVRKHRADSARMTGIIDATKEKLVKTFNELVEVNGSLPSPEQILGRMRGEAPKKETAVRLVSYIDKFIEKHCASERTALKFIGLRRMVEAMEEARRPGMPFAKYAQGSGVVYLSTASIEDYADLSLMLDMATTEIPHTFNHQGVEKLKFSKSGNQYSSATKNKYQTNFCLVLRTAKKEGKTVNLDPDSLEKAPKVSDTKSYLQPNEIAAWMHCSHYHTGEPVTLHNGQENARKLFGIALMTGVRYDDISTIISRKPHRVEGTEISFDCISYMSKKTGTKVAIPVFYHLEKILQDPPTLITNQKLNEHVKEIARLLGLDRPQHIVTTRANGNFAEETLQLNEVLSVHGARRSAYTTLLSMPLFLSRQIVTASTGHVIEKSNSADLGYLSLKPEGAAEALLIQAAPRVHKLPYRFYTEAVAKQLGIDESNKPQ